MMQQLVSMSYEPKMKRGNSVKPHMKMSEKELRREAVQLYALKVREKNALKIE